MFQYVPRAPASTLLFRSWEEGLALWRTVTEAFPELLALCLMPDHLHLILPHPDALRRLRRMMSGYTRWRNHARGADGPAWRPLDPPDAIQDRQHLRRVIRYTHLNPCRARLVRDPLAWPLSTHRDAVGYASNPAVPLEREPERFHRYVSADDTVDSAGTSLPMLQHVDFRWEDIRDAASAIGRVPVWALEQRGPARTLAVRTAWVHGLRDTALLSSLTGMSTNRILEVCAGLPRRGALLAEEALSACVRATGDPRFGPLQHGDLRLLPTWGRYRRSS